MAEVCVDGAEVKITISPPIATPPTPLLVTIPAVSPQTKLVSQGKNVLINQDMVMWAVSFSVPGYTVQGFDGTPGVLKGGLIKSTAPLSQILETAGEAVILKTTQYTLQLMPTPPSANTDAAVSEPDPTPLYTATITFMKSGQMPPTLYADH